MLRRQSIEKVPRVPRSHQSLLSTPDHLWHVIMIVCMVAVTAEAEQLTANIDVICALCLLKVALNKPMIAPCSIQTQTFMVHRMIPSGTKDGIVGSADTGPATCFFLGKSTAIGQKGVG
ncbi:MAG: hypothetical protein ETSY1_45710 [Candidatus Entotheonella factor]|uniref:Uncharacterized protein n=1 Tax=Entotheonella factor TaxID=1429438 RepID=W4L1P3_ENTF1|nr:MAG: hypothetical protein ETSY1_45710 [Candidatus Entotheonella factor]